MGYIQRGPFAQGGVIFDPAADPPLHLGHLGRTLTAYQESIALVARNELNVIVDVVVLDEKSWRGWLLALRGLRSYWVRVEYSLEICDECKGTAWLGWPGPREKLCIDTLVTISPWTPGGTG